MRSSLTLGLVYIALGGLSVSGIGGHRPIGAVQWALAALLVAAGAFLLTRLRAAFYFALAVAVLTAITGVLALAHHPELALPVTPWVSVGVGLYLVLRVALASPAFATRKKGFIP
jgi:hypothetical protein